MASIDKSTIDFLKNLKENNNRDWFNEYKLEFQIVQQKAKDFYNALMLNWLEPYGLFISIAHRLCEILVSLLF